MVNVLVIAATELELKSFVPVEFRRSNVNLVSAVLGVGDVASAKLVQLLSRYKFHFVLLVGSCGSSEFASGTIVAPSYLVDSNGVSNLCLEWKNLQFESLQDLYVSMFPRSALVNVIDFSPMFSNPPNSCVTGGVVCDMESYSIAGVCRKHGVPLWILKIVVDGRGNEIASLGDYLRLERTIYEDKSFFLKIMIGDCILALRDLIEREQEHCDFSGEFVSKNIIALDTCVCRELAYEDNVSWFDSFLIMKNSGIEFCIPDVCFFEIVNQFARGSITSQQWQKMFIRLKAILSHSFPIMPSGTQLFQLIGVVAQDTYGNEFVQKHYMEMFSKITAVQSVDALMNLRIRFSFSGKEYGCVNNISQIEKYLQDERNKWCNRIQYEPSNLEGARQRIDEEFPAQPKVSERLDIFIKQIDRCVTRLGNGDYNPMNKKKKNDGVDMLALMVMAIPSRFCTLDSLNGIKSIESFQRDWIMSPKEIVNAFNHHSLNKVTWQHEFS